MSRDPGRKSYGNTCAVGFAVSKVLGESDGFGLTSFSGLKKVPAFSLFDLGSSICDLANLLDGFCDFFTGAENLSIS